MLTLVCRVGKERFVLDVRQVVEVIPRVHLQAVAGTPEWFAGVFAYRGQVTPVVDLARLTGGEPCPSKWSNRILLVRSGESDSFVGILVEQVVTGERDAANEGRRTSSPWGATLMDAEGMYQLLDLSMLFADERREVLAHLGPEEVG